MRRRLIVRAARSWAAGALAFLPWYLAPAARAETTLWRLGHADGAAREFALAPDGFAKFAAVGDGFFVVGKSSESRDWPYVHPGPADDWAGRRAHTFAIAFGIKAAPAGGECRLVVDLVDTHPSGPPVLAVSLNGEALASVKLPAGGADASVRGDAARAKPHTKTFAFPASKLLAGDNVLAFTTSGGSWMVYDDVALYGPDGLAPSEVAGDTFLTGATAAGTLVRKDGKLYQPVRVTVRRGGADSGAAVARVAGGPAAPLGTAASQTVEVLAPPIDREQRVAVTLERAGKQVASTEVAMKPVRQLTVYILPHSHTDIGYTEIQTAIEKKQVDNLVAGIEAARKTADYPEGARFVWNVEVLWAADLYLKRLPEAQQRAFFDAVKRGQVALNGMYLNELTGLCRPEELLRLFRFSTELSKRTGVPIDSAMISDVPGYTWGTVPALSQAGIKYFSVAPNYFDRIGTILREWENKPFYWLGQDGKSRVLVWIPYRGYAMSHVVKTLNDDFVADYVKALESSGYPYDVSYMRWSGHGDNAVPDPAICDFVRDWNARHAWPRFVIASTSTAFRAFEERHGKSLPTVKGDWTPYWEDGAGSSALETAMNRGSADRLSQAEALVSMLDPSAYPAEAFEDAWNHVLLYSEHTWGAWCSVSEPERKETREQWEIKRSYATAADAGSRGLLERALAMRGARDAARANNVDVLNTLAWPRTEVVRLSRELSSAGDAVVDERGEAVPSQRLSGGELAFLAGDVPAMGGKRYRVMPGKLPEAGDGGGGGGTVASIENDKVRVRIDPKTGDVVELSAAAAPSHNFAGDAPGALNQYLYLIGDDPARVQRVAGPVTSRTVDDGPLVKTVTVESGAPGCNRLTRTIRITSGSDRVEVTNLVDKKRLEAANYKKPDGKEAVHFAFPFNVPSGQVRIDVPFGVVRPEVDQMPSACKNWFTASRWADVSAAERGITLVTLDAPLLEVGGITATLLESQSNPDVWRKHVEPTQAIYSWAMNNHWGTNYRAYQEGPVEFRYVLRPHGKYAPAENARFALAVSQPLIAAPAVAPRAPASLLSIDGPDVLVTAVKPSDDGGRALIVRLYNPCDGERAATLRWGSLKPRRVLRTDTSEAPGEAVRWPLAVGPHELVALRVELE